MHNPQCLIIRGDPVFNGDCIAEVVGLVITTTTSLVT